MSNDKGAKKAFGTQVGNSMGVPPGQATARFPNEDQPEVAKVAAKLPEMKGEKMGIPDFLKISGAELDAIDYDAAWELARKVSKYLKGIDAEIQALRDGKVSGEEILRAVQPKMGLTAAVAPAVAARTTQEAKAPRAKRGPNKPKTEIGAGLVQHILNSVKGQGGFTSKELRELAMKEAKMTGFSITEDDFKAAFPIVRKSLKPAKGSPGRGPKATFDLVT
jgi:hypothetical protein